MAAGFVEENAGRIIQEKQGSTTKAPRREANADFGMWNAD
jgi:hypothetical protein